MPTRFEAIELIDNCTLSEETVKSVKGIRLTSKINGNSIFFPYCDGYYNNDKYVTSSVSFLRTSTCSGQSGYRKATPHFITYRNYEGTLNCSVGGYETSGLLYNSYLSYAMNIRAVYDASK